MPFPTQRLREDAAYSYSAGVIVHAALAHPVGCCDARPIIGRAQEVTAMGVFNGAFPIIAGKEDAAEPSLRAAWLDSFY